MEVSMKSTAQKLILISFVLALFAAISVFFYLKSLNSVSEINKKTTVLVAADTIPSGTLIDKKMVKEIDVSDNSILGDYINDSSKIIGKYTKQTIYKNEGFNEGKLLDKSGDELSLKIDNNNRAVSINVTGDSGVSDLLKPGDHVDIVVYMAEKKDGAKVVRPDEAKILLQNIELLAVDKQLNRDAKTDDKVSDKEKILTNYLVTLSIPISELEKLVLAQSIGTIKLALRPLNDDNIMKTNGTTVEDISVNVSGEGTTSDKSDEGNSSSAQSNTTSSESNSNDKYKNYTVQPGDTLKKISSQFYGDENKYTIIKAANNIKDENLILTGEVIKIPILQE
jgi:pilus assembly protein CpaB